MKGLPLFDYCEGQGWQREAPVTKSRTRKAPNLKVKAIVGGREVVVHAEELWTAKQRQASSLQEVSYRACFKPQLPRYFIERYSGPGDIVYDPFSGRGTTAIEAALMGRVPYANDINPLSEILARPRISIPSREDIKMRLASINYDYRERPDIDLSMFYEEKTAAEVTNLRHYFLARRASSAEDDVDRWRRMVATNRLTGHSPGFFSVYSLPPNQAASQKRQIKINEKLKQTPEYRDTKAIILRKTKQLLGCVGINELSQLSTVSSQARFFTGPSSATPEIAAESVQLVVTSPPFLDVVQYAADNWLRCWFNGIDASQVAGQITQCRNVDLWSNAMTEVFIELYRVVKPGGYVAFEVGEVNKGRIKLEDYVIPVGGQVGFVCEKLFINTQTFTKTSNIWGVGNNQKGTNTNRIVLLRKE